MPVFLVGYIHCQSTETLKIKPLPPFCLVKSAWTEVTPIIMCIDPSDLSPCPLFNCKILMVLLWCTFCHQKQPTHYTDLVFMPLFLQQLEGTGEVDLVWESLPC